MFGGMIYGLSAAVMGEITFSDGEVEQYNFPDYDALRMHNAPVTQVKILETNHHMGGVGEPGTPPSMPALGNALFDLTGERARTLPLINQFNLLV
jgi:isoquinoline 1-oxidoreductase beta subunit